MYFQKQVRQESETNGGVAQLGERLPCKQEVTSSNLVISIRGETNRHVGASRMYLENCIEEKVNAEKKHQIEMQG